MIVQAVISLLLAVAGAGILFGTFRNLRRDAWAIRARDRFFGKWFRWLWLVAGLVSSYLLVNAAWLVWVSPIKALLYVAMVPVVAGSLVVGARKVLPWVYERSLRR